MAPVFGRPRWVKKPGNKTRCKHACVPHVLSLHCLCVCSTEPSPKAPASFSVARAVWAPPYLPPYLPPSFLPRASFPVPLSLPAAASFDFVSDFPRKGLWGGHGVKNITFLTHSLGKTDQRASPSLCVGLTCCLFYLPERVTWCRDFILFFLNLVLPCHCFFMLMWYKSCMLNICVTFQSTLLLQIFVNAFPPFQTSIGFK